MQNRDFTELIDHLFVLFQKDNLSTDEAKKLKEFYESRSSMDKRESPGSKLSETNSSKLSKDPRNRRISSIFMSSSKDKLKNESNLKSIKEVSYDMETAKTALLPSSQTT